jgi:hypothetical protein
MGVDISVSARSLAQCAEAKCKSFRPNAFNPAIPSKQTSLLETDNQRWIIPTDSIPMSIETPTHEKINRQPLNPSRFAIDLTISTNERDKRVRFHFHQWVTQDEYIQLKEEYIRRFTERMQNSVRPLSFHEQDFWHDLSYDAQRNICNSCPLSTNEYVNCEPGLFSYSNLHRLRASATLIFAVPPLFVREQVIALIEDFFQILPDNVYTDTRNISALSDANIRTILSEYIGTVEASKHFPSPEAEKYALTANKIINRLFFRDNDNDETYWLHSEKLELVVDWLNQLLEVAKTIFESGLIINTDDFAYFIEKVEIFTQAHETALKYNLKIGTSW